MSYFARDLWAKCSHDELLFQLEKLWSDNYKLRQERRYETAKAALQGLMSRECDMRFQSLDGAANEAVWQADQLLAELEKEGK